MNQIAETIKALRKKNDMSQETLAESLFVSRQAISKWERGEAVPDIENLSALSDLFGVSVDNLIKGENNVDVAQPSRSQNNTELKEKYQHLKSKSTLFTIVAIILFIISPSIYVLFDEKNWQSSTVTFLVLIGLAVGLIIYASSLSNRYRDLIGLKKEDEEEEMCQSTLSGKISSVVSILATITFLILGFFYGMWHPGWIVFLLVPLSKSIISLFEKK